MFNSSARILKDKHVFKIYNVQFENCKFKLLFSVNLVYLQAVNILNAGEKRFYHVQCTR